MSIRRPIVTVYLLAHMFLLANVTAAFVVQESEQTPNQQESERKLQELESTAVQHGLDMGQLDALRELHVLGASFFFRRGYFEIVLYRDAENPLPEHWHGTIDDLDLIATLRPNGVKLMSDKIGVPEVQRICRLDFLETLHLTKITEDITPEVWQELHQLTNLTSFSINSMKANDDLLAKLSSLPNAESLFLGSGTYSAAGLAKLKESLSLKSLTISYSHFDDPTFAALCQLHNLENLSLSYIQASNEAYSGIAKMKNLKSISMSGENNHKTYHEVGDGALEAIGELEELESIHLYRTQVDDKDWFPKILKAWEAPADADARKTLYLLETLVTDDSIELMLKSERLGFQYASVVFPKGVSKLAADKLADAHPTWNVVYMSNDGAGRAGTSK